MLFVESSAVAHDGLRTLQYQNVVPSDLPCYAVKVRCRSEERVAISLQKKGYCVLLPRYLEQRRYSDRIRKLSSPLFPGYIFCRFDIAQSLPIRTTPGVSYIVGSGRTFAPLSENEAAIVNGLSFGSVQTEACPYMRVGQRVCVESGLLAGVCGTLQNIKGMERVVLSIDLLQRSVSVEVDRACIRSLD
jgi:transcription antitermination factor NusG